MITGATGGIGNALVKRFVSLDGNVLATGTKTEKLDDLKNEFSELRNGKSLWRVILIIIIVLAILETIIGRPDPKRMKTEN